MAFLGADTDELREVGQEFEQGKEVTDQVITYLKALIAILKAASFFSGGASLAYAQYLETTVVPWLEKISQALGLFAKVLGSQAEAQDTASQGGTVPTGTLPSYTTPALPEPIKPYDGAPIAPVPGSGTVTGGATGAPTTIPTTSSGPSLTIGENGHLMIDTGIDLDGPGGPGSAPLTGGTAVGGMIGGLAGGPTGGNHGLGTSGISPTSSGMAPGTDLGPVRGGTTIGDLGSPTGGPTGELRTGSDSPLGGGAIGGGSLGGGSLGGGAGAPTGGSGAPLGGPTGGDTAPSGGAGSPGAHGGPLADGGMGGASPGAEKLGTAEMAPVAATTPEAGSSPSYGAAAGIAGGAAALGLGGAALAAKGGAGAAGDAKIDSLAGSNGRGSRGEDVRELQERLTSAGYDTQGSDGVWGGNTQAAYEAYRADHPLSIQRGEGYTSPGGYDYQQITGVRGNANVTPDFLREVEGVAGRIGAQPEHLMAAMSFETGGTFASDVRNPRSTATGLIQFMGETATGLGTSTEALAAMTPTEQLRYVEQYFAPYRGRLGDLESVYTTILAGSPHSGQEPLFTQGEKTFGPNRELDANGNGVITAAEATAHVRSRMGAGGSN